MKSVLTIAGSDACAGAGIQADLKTMGACGVYGTCAITALTAQNTLGVTAIHEVPPEFLECQLDSIFTDIFPDAVKIGMVCSSGLIAVICDKLTEYQPHNIVLDPILVSTSGTSLLKPDAEHTMKERLFPLVDVLTPNVPECERLSGISIESHTDMEHGAQALGRQYGGAVLCKGGHLGEGADDLLYHNGTFRWFPGERLSCSNNHGTGCTYSSAFASALALGYDLPQAAAFAKEYMTGALSDGLNLGQGNGPLNHFWKYSHDAKLNQI